MTPNTRVYVAQGRFVDREGIVMRVEGITAHVALDGGLGDVPVLIKHLYVIAPAPTSEAWPEGLPTVRAWLESGRCLRYHPLFIAA